MMGVAKRKIHKKEAIASTAEHSRRQIAFLRRLWSVSPGQANLL